MIQMQQVNHQKSPSQFTFQSHQSQQQLKNNHLKISNEVIFNDQFFFNIGSLDEQFEYYQKNHEINEELSSTNRKSYAPIKKQELQKVFKYFRKYQPLYFTKIMMKQLSSKFKKGVFIKKYKQGFYFGEVSDIKNNDGSISQKIKNGKGIFVYNFFDKKDDNNNRIYEGEWVNDKKNGIGFQKFQDNSVYHGHYRDNKPDGRGKFTNNQGQVYEGEWKNGTKQGKGFWQGIKGQTYMGEWKDSKPNGYGVFVTQNGNRYQGQFKNALKHGQGIQRFANGDMYKGFFQNDKPHGYGEYYWKNRSYFKGSFINGLRQGQGLWKKGAGNCDQYQGQYQNDKKWGYGTFTWSNGNIYKGNYEADLRNGYGQMYWKDGNYYKGDWKNGIQHGKGQLFVVGEGLRVGIFDNNEIVKIEYQQPNNDDQENQENKLLQIKSSYKQLIRNSSKVSNSTSKSKNSMQFRMKTQQKNLLTHKRSSQSIYEKPQKLNLTIPHKIDRKKIFSQAENGMRSVPLKSLGNTQNNNLNFFSKTRVFKPEAEFRISQKLSMGKNMNKSIDESRTTKYQEPHKRNNRILHSSFYLHKFRKLKSQQNDIQAVKIQQNQ